MQGLARAQAAAAHAAKRFEVKFARREQVIAWLGEASRTTFLLDVRTREEFESLRIAQARHAPGGQLVQATDEFVGVRHARVVLIDPKRVRSVMTASWLNQMGFDEVFVLEPEGEDGFAGWETASGVRPAPFTAAAWACISPAQLASHVTAKTALVLDLSTSLQFRAKHVADAWWAVRSRLDQAREKCGAARTVVLTAANPQLAQLAAPEAALIWPDADVLVLEGGNAAWFAPGLPVEATLAHSTTTHDDVWYKPYDHEHEGDYEKHARAYLEWEVALVEQIRRDPAIHFRAYD